MQQHDHNHTIQDPFAFPNSEVLENMIYEPGNIDWVGQRSLTLPSNSFYPMEQH
jgi:hypothetical protein